MIPKPIPLLSYAMTPKPIDLYFLRRESKTYFPSSLTPNPIPYFSNAMKPKPITNLLFLLLRKPKPIPLFLLHQGTTTYSPASLTL